MLSKFQNMSNGMLGLLIFGASTSAIVLSVSIMDWWEKRRSKRRRSGSQTNNDAFPGLYNMGNNCYINSLMQGFAASGSFLHWLSKFQQSPKKTPLLSGMHQLISRLSTFSDETESSEGVVACLENAGWIVGGGEQDIFELLNVLNTTWDEELEGLNAADGSLLGILNDCVKTSKTVDIGTSSVKGRFQMLTLTRAGPDLKPPCAGLIGTMLECRVCHRKRVRHDRFTDLSMAIPKTTPYPCITVEHCMRKYFSMEVVEGARCEHCLSKNLLDGTHHIKRQGISKLPQSLILRIERKGVLPTGSLFKHRDFIQFGEYLDISEVIFTKRLESNPLGPSTSSLTGGRATSSRSPVLSSTTTNTNPLFVPSTSGQSSNFQSPSLISGGSHVMGKSRRNQYRYRLRCVVEHLGAVERGHFVAYRRDNINDDIDNYQAGGKGRAAGWFRISDAVVRRVSAERVFSAEAYMLFYERVPQQQQQVQKMLSQNSTSTTPRRIEGISSPRNFANLSSTTNDANLVTQSKYVAKTTDVVGNSGDNNNDERGQSATISPSVNVL